MRSRALTFVIALVLAVVGTIAVLDYTHGADKRALQGMKAVSVVVASKQIPSGTPAGSLTSQGLVQIQQEPASAVPPEALHSIPATLSSLVTNADIQPGQLLLRPMLATAAPVTGGLQVPPGLVAISFQVCLTEAVEGFVQPGSEVVVFDLANGPGKSGTSLSDAPVCSGSHSQGGPLTISVVLARVKILAVGQTVPAPAVPGATPAPTPTTGGAGASQSSQMVPITVAVSQADAEKLMALTESGIPYLGLINATSPGSTVSSSTSTVRP